MKTLNYLLFLIMPVVFSCTEKIELNIAQTEPQLVLNSLITPDSIIKVHISKTAPVLSEQKTAIRNAHVELRTNDTTIEILQETKPGTYLSSETAQTEKNYTLYIDVPGFEQLSASAQINPPPVVINGTIKINSHYEQYLSMYVSESDISFLDPQDIENYYQISFFNYNPYMQGDTIINFTDSVRSYGEVTYLKSNSPAIINEGDFEYSGYESISSIVLSDKLLNNTNIISFLLKFRRYTYLSRNVLILKNISRDYYLYHKSWIRQHANQGIHISNPIDVFLSNNPNDLYSNVKNGLGIFAGYSETYFELTIIDDEKSDF